MMDIQLPRIFENKLQELTKDVAIEFRKLIVKMKELELEDTGYTFFNNGCKVKVTEVELTNEEDEEGFSFCVEEDTVHGTTYTLDSEYMDIEQLLELYQKYYNNNISTIQACV